MKFKDNYICIAGDLNSHTGTERDYVIIDDFNQEQLDCDNEAQALLDNVTYAIIGLCHREQYTGPTWIWLNPCSSNNILFS